jgi:hypothetical protein
MNLYMLQYYGSYIGGTVCVIADSLDEAAKIVKKKLKTSDICPNYKVILDEEQIQAWRFVEECMDQDWNKVNLLTFVKEHYPLIYTKVKYIVEDPEDIVSDGESIRVDWIEDRLDIPDGLYLDCHIKIGEEYAKPGIISHSVHEG